LLRKKEVAELLGIRERIISILVEHELLVSDRSKDLPLPLFDIEKIETFRQSYVFVREAAMLLDVPHEKVLKIFKGRIQPILGGEGMPNCINQVFRREDISALLRGSL
jgi:hypothetical protein